MEASMLNILDADASDGSSVLRDTGATQGQREARGRRASQIATRAADRQTGGDKRKVVPVGLEVETSPTRRARKTAMEKLTHVAVDKAEDAVVDLLDHVADGVQSVAGTIDGVVHHNDLESLLEVLTPEDGTNPDRKRRGGGPTKGIKAQRLHQASSVNEETAAMLDKIKTAAQHNEISLDDVLSPHTLVDQKLRDEYHLKIFFPNSALRRYWGWFINCVILYISVMTPFEFSELNVFHLFGNRDWGSGNAEVNMIDYFFNVVFVLDIMMHCSTAFVTEDGYLVLNRKEIVHNYTRTGLFWCDFLAILPIYMANQNWWVFWKLFCVQRLFIRNRVWDKMEASEWAWFWRVMKLLVVLLFCVHWGCCGWAALVLPGKAYNPDTLWYQKRANQVGETHQEKYFYAFYQTVQMIVGGEGYPTTTIETFFSSMLTLTGTVIQGYILSEITTIVNNARQDTQAYMRKMDFVNKAMRYLHISDGLQSRVRRFYEYSYHVNSGDPGQKWLTEISPTLQMDVLMSMHGDIVTKVPLFAKADVDFVAEVIVRLSNRLFIPGDFIIRLGSIGEEMFFVVKGVVGVTDGLQRPLANLHEGAFFGEIALIQRHAQRTASVSALTYVDLRVLGREDLESLLEVFTEEAAHIKQIAKQRLKRGGDNTHRDADEADDGSPIPRSDSAGLWKKGKMKINTRTAVGNAIGADQSHQFKKLASEWHRNVRDWRVIEQARKQRNVVAGTGIGLEVEKQTRMIKECQSELSGVTSAVEGLEVSMATSMAALQSSLAGITDTLRDTARGGSNGETKRPEAHTTAQDGNNNQHSPPPSEGPASSGSNRIREENSAKPVRPENGKGLPAAKKAPSRRRSTYQMDQAEMKRQEKEIERLRRKLSTASTATTAFTNPSRRRQASLRQQRPSTRLVSQGRPSGAPSGNAEEKTAAQPSDDGEHPLGREMNVRVL